MSEKAELPLRAEDAVAKLKRSREHTVSPDSDATKTKRSKTVEAMEPSLPETPPTSLTVNSSRAIEGVSHFPRRRVGSVVYSPNKLLVRGHELQFNSILQVKVGHLFLENPEPVKRRAVWGTEVYTDDTDIIAALHHSGYLGTAETAGDLDEDLSVDLLLLPPLREYKGSLRNGLNSRTWLTRHDGISYMILGPPKPMPAGWAHAGKELLFARYEALKELRQWDPRDIAYV